MATSEYCSCPPRLPTPTASHVAIASGVNHRVTSPRWTSARSYAGQFPTRYFVLYLGCTLDFTSRSCPFGRHDGQGRDEHLLPRTNAACRAGRAISKVIIEAALLTDDEKRTACLLARAAGADFIKTSTGFGPGGATVADVALMRATVGPDLGIKAAGGVREYDAFQAMVRAGATRIGSSAGVQIVQQARDARGKASLSSPW